MYFNGPHPLMRRESLFPYSNGCRMARRKTSWFSFALSVVRVSCSWSSRTILNMTNVVKANFYQPLILSQK